jgi:hypothetical protein
MTGSYISEVQKPDPSAIIELFELELVEVTRIRTAAMFLNGESTANSSATSRNEVYFIVRKSTENREIVEFELAQAWDLPGVKLPKRQVLPRQFPGIGAFHE